MIDRHTFTIRGQKYTLNSMTLLAVFAIATMQVPEHRPNCRVMALKQLRSVTGLGLYEAKAIVDYVAERGSISESGEIIIRPAEITYEPGA